MQAVRGVEEEALVMGKRLAAHAQEVHEGGDVCALGVGAALRLLELLRVAEQD